MPELRVLELTDFKCIPSARIEIGESVSTLVGPNNSGKSSVLQAVQACRCVLELPIADPLAKQHLRRYLGELVAKGKRRSMVRYGLQLTGSEISAIRRQFTEWLGKRSGPAEEFAKGDEQLIPADFTVEVEVVSDPFGYGDIKVNSITTVVAGDRAIRVFSPGPQGGLPILLPPEGIVEIAKRSSISVRSDGLPQSSYLAQPLGMPPSQWANRQPGTGSYTHLDFFVEFTKGFCLIPASRHYPRETDIAGAEASYMDPDGRVALPQLLSFLATDKPAQLRRLERGVSGILPEVKNLFGRTAGSPKAEVRVAEEAELEAADAHPAWQAGTGLSHLVTVLGFALGRPRGSLLALEEPELSLHPGTQRKLGDELLRIVEDSSLQLLITTHSPAFVTAFSAFTILACRRSPKGSEIRLVSQASLDEVRDQLALSQRTRSLQTMCLLSRDRRRSASIL